MQALVCKCSWCCRYLWGDHMQGATSGFLFPVLPASPPLFWFYNQHFSPQSLVSTQLRGSRNNLHATQVTHKDHLPVFHTQSRVQKCDSSARSLLAVGAERPLLCSSATEIDLQAALRCVLRVVVWFSMSCLPDCFAPLSFLLHPLPRPPSASAALQNGNSE